jgi:hypothetical protein
MNEELFIFKYYLDGFHAYTISITAGSNDAKKQLFVPLHATPPSSFSLD